MLLHPINVKTVKLEASTWNSISTHQYIMYLILGVPREYLSDDAVTFFCMIP